MKGITVLQGEIIAKEKNTLKFNRKKSSPASAGQFNQIWYKLSLGKRN
jgi:hypothetical protein